MTLDDRQGRGRRAGVTRRLMALTVLLCALASGAQPAPQFLIRNFRFEPAELTVPAGTSVTWTNEDEDAHTVVSNDGLFRSSALDTHERFSFKFEKPGTYHFACSLHPQMTGTVNVK
jgi:plastocyanin